MPLPPAYDERGDVRPLDDEELYRYWASTIARHHAGGWSPDSIPGIEAMKEFEAFVRETQARAVETFVSRTVAVEMEPGWSLSGYTDLIRDGLVDLSGNRVAS